MNSDKWWWELHLANVVPFFFFFFPLFFDHLLSWLRPTMFLKLSKFLRRSLLIFIIKGFRTIVFIFVISTTFRPICPPASFKCLLNSGKPVFNKITKCHSLTGFLPLFGKRHPLILLSVFVLIDEPMVLKFSPPYQYWFSIWSSIIRM